MSPTALAHAIDRFEVIEQRLRDRRVALFLDYDGTLTPIVARPELAVLSNDMRQAVAALAAELPVAIVSGRDRREVQELVGLDSLYYAGSHGFDISGPRGLERIHPAGTDAAPSLDRATDELETELRDIEGALVERKRFAVATHYRLVGESERERVRAAFEQVASRHADLRTTGGKCVYELRPDVTWNKGSAVEWLLEAFGLNSTNWLPCYIGDDETDEDAFAVVADRGIGIVVADDRATTRAQYYLRSPTEVGEFLRHVHHAVTPKSDPPRRQ